MGYHTGSSTHTSPGQQCKHILTTLVTAGMGSVGHDHNGGGVLKAAAEGVSSFSSNRSQTSTEILSLSSYTLIRPSCQHYQYTPPLGR